ncbi:MAG: HD domain-containing phosphohydrolase [Dehalococcoidia bacterium]
MTQLRLAAAWVGKSIFFPTRHIRWKIIAPYVVLTAVIAAAGTFMATRLVTGSLQERFENQLAEAGRVTSDSVVRRERQHLEVVRGISFTDGVAGAAENGDGDKLNSLVLPLAANSQTELVEVLDVRGERVYGAHLANSEALQYEPIADDADRSTWPAVQRVVAQDQDSLGDKYAQIVQTEYGYALYTAGPIYDGETFAGVVLIGSLLQSFLPVAKTEALADITFYDFEGAPLASTFVTPESKDEGNLTPHASVAADFDQPGAIRESKTLFGRDFDLLYGPVVIRNQAVGMYSVALPSSFILSAGSSTRWQLGALFALTMSIVLAAGWLLARSLTRPLLRLVQAARAVTAGDLTARSGVHTSDEVGVLANSFDLMTERLQRQHLATIRALTSAIDARDPYTAGHSSRVGQLAVLIGEDMDLAVATLQHLEIGGYLHDIGKIGVRDSILLKPGRLTPEEREMIERHPHVGLDILKPVHLAPEVIAFVGGHHEKLDGSGYPRGKRATELTVIPRIAAIADIYDALTTDRPYRDAMTVDESVAIMRREAEDGKLDRSILVRFERLIPDWERLRRTDPALKGFRLPDDPLAQVA